MRLHWAACLILALASVKPASATLTVLVGEPYGSFGTMMPTGHTAVYLDRVCADGPLKLRMCRPGEPQGVVIARYHRIGDTDWIATPVMQYFYATDRVEDIPAFATPTEVAALREQFRLRYLREIVADGRQRSPENEDWYETAGNAYDRRFWGYRLASTREQDERFVEAMNAEANRHRYRLRHGNCADFAADAVNFFYPDAVRANRVADFGVMSPKQVARRVAALGSAETGANLQVIEIPQVPGSLRRSRPVRGGSEMVLTTKRYLVTLLVIQPEMVAGLAIVYFDNGRWKIGQGAEPVTPTAFESPRTTIVASR
jgi:hypothetical protein